MELKKIIPSLGLIIIIIALSTLAVRHLTSAETLSEYAAANPELAYATPEPLINEVQSDNFSSAPTAAPDDTSAPDAAASFTSSLLSDEIKARITGISYPADDEGIEISYDDLRYLTVLYYDFYGEIQNGELICNKYIADDLLEIFLRLYENEYPIQSIRLIDEYGGDDTLSMEDNNTSCFNYRVVENTTSLSKHALGLAIDINPFYNPYIVFGQNADGSDYISPKGSESFADRSLDFAHKIDKDDLCYKLFKEHGFTWGGDWKTVKDYQHFQKVP